MSCCCNVVIFYCFSHFLQWYHCLLLFQPSSKRKKLHKSLSSSLTSLTDAVSESASQVNIAVVNMCSFFNACCTKWQYLLGVMRELKKLRVSHYGLIYQREDGKVWKRDTKINYFDIITQSKSKTPITRSVHCKFNCITVVFDRTPIKRKALNPPPHILIPFIYLWK